MPSVISSYAYQQLRAELRALWTQVNAACWLCGQAIDYTAPANTPNALELDHVKPRKSHPELALERSNCRPSHHRCNRGRGVSNPLPPLGSTSEHW